MEKQITYISMKVELAQALVNYLQTRPYIEVAKLIEGVLQSSTAKKEEKE